MVMLEPEFLYGVVRKSLLLGFVAAAVTLFTVSAEFAGAVAIGTLVSAINLRIVAYSIKRMLEAGRDGGTSANAWSLLLAGKMLVLIAVVWCLIAYVNVNAVGFVFGFSLFMPAIGVQVVTSKPNGSEEDSEG
jgi:hypothetical protein